MLNKIITRYLIFAAVIVFMFGVIYWQIIVIDISSTFTKNKILMEEINKYRKDKESKMYVEKFEELNTKFKNESHITNISLNYLKSNNQIEAYKKYFFDSLYFSAVTFFTIGYGDFYPSGIARVIVIIEGFLGTGLVPIFIALSLTVVDRGDDNSEEKQEEIKIRLNRGENIVGIFKEKYQFTKIILIDKSGNIHKYFLKNISPSFEGLIKKFQIEYYFNISEYNQDLFYAFAIYVEIIIGDIVFKNPVSAKKPFSYNEFDFKTALRYFQDLEIALRDNQCEHQQDYSDYFNAMNKVKDAYDNLCKLKHKNVTKL